PIDPVVVARWVDLRRDQRVEVAPDRVDVRREKADAAVLGVEEAAVEVDELGGALVEGRADHLEHLLDRGRGVALRRRPGAFHAEAARCAAQAEAAGASRVDHEVAAVHGRDAPHRRAACRVPLVEAWLRNGAAHAVPPQSTHPAPRGSASATHVPAATSRCWLRPAFAAPRRSASASLAASAPTASAREAARAGVAGAASPMERVAAGTHAPHGRPTSVVTTPRASRRTPITKGRPARAACPPSIAAAAGAPARCNTT